MACANRMHPTSIASLRVASSSFAVMKMTGHFDPDAASRRLQLNTEIPPRWISSSKQVTVCTLSLSSNASAEANVRLARQKAGIVINHDHDCRLLHHIRIQPFSCRCMAPTGGGAANRLSGSMEN
jgi:hypothetical protein